MDARELTPGVVNTLLNAKAPSTREQYSIKWRVFEKWCAEQHIIPFQCSATKVVCFLQSLLEKGLAASTLKGYVAAISTYHTGSGSSTLGEDQLVRWFMKGVLRSRPVSKRVTPSWDLPLVLDALSSQPFEPLEDIDMKMLSLKTALLLALSSAKRPGELHALSVSPMCMDFGTGQSKVSLRFNPAFMPKVMSAPNSMTVELNAFHPPPFLSPEDQRLNCLCPVRALHAYVDRTKACRQSSQLFVSWAPPRMGRPITKERLSHWVVDAIAMAYRCKGRDPPNGLRAHSTRGIAASWALFKGLSVQEICAAASWSTPGTFIRFYRLDVTAPSVAHAVLGVGSS